MEDAVVVQVVKSVLVGEKDNLVTKNGYDS